jgi:hypothetical protein
MFFGITFENRPFSAAWWNALGPSGQPLRNRALRMGKHLAGQSEHSFGGKGLAEDDDIRLDVVGRVVAAGAQNQDREIRNARSQLVHKRGPANSARLVAADDQTQLPRKFGLFDQAKCFGCVGGPAHFAEPPSQERKQQGSLE